MANAILGNLMNQYVALTSTMNIMRMVTPKNHSEQMDYWINAAEKWGYKNPYFVYDEGYLTIVSAQLDQLKDLEESAEKTDLANFDSDDRLTMSLLKSRITGAVATAELAKSILSKRDVDSGNILRKKFGQVDKRSFNRANDYISLMREAHENPRRADAAKKILLGRKPLFDEDELKVLKTKKVTPEEIVKITEHELAENGYDDFEVKLNPKATRVRTYGYSRGGHPYIVIPARNFPALYVAQEIGREIDCNVRLLANGAKVFNGIGSGAFLPDDLTIFVGNAIRYEIEFKCMTLGKTIKMPSPWVIIALNKAQKGHSFAEVSRHVFDLCTQAGVDYPKARQEAWNATFQVFKGCRNPNYPERYAFLQVRQEFDGYDLIEKLRHDRRAMPWLDLGVFSPTDLELLKPRLRGIPKPEHLVADLSGKIARDFLTNH